MPPHTHQNPEFRDLDSAGLSVDEDHHLAYRFGEVGEEPFDTQAPYLPLSLSFGPPKLEASRETLKYGLVRDFWANPEAPTEEDRQALLKAALKLLPAHIEAVEDGRRDILDKRHFVRPS